MESMDLEFGGYEMKNKFKQILNTISLLFEF